MKSIGCSFPVCNTLEETASLLAAAAKNFSKIVVISDQEIYETYGSNLFISCPHTAFFVPQGEKAKTLAIAADCWEYLFSENLDRKGLIIALGGGSITDLAGFVASTYLRGVASYYVPTTLLGMIDAAIGGKTGINTQYGKNTLGTFTEPQQVMISLPFLESLPERQYRSGLAELIKYGVIAGEELFSFLEQNSEQLLARDPQVLQSVITRSIAVKQEIVRRDFRDQHLRALLNWGHTFAHAIEKITHYSRFTHGEAVAIGMNCAAFLSLSLGIVKESFIQRQRSLIEALGLPSALPEDLDVDSLIAQMAKDKKCKEGAFFLTLTKGIGVVFKAGPINKEEISQGIAMQKSEALCLR